MVVRIVSIDSSLGSSLLVADAGPGTAGTALSVLSRAEQSSPRRHAESLGAMLARVLAAPGVADHPLDAVIAATGPAPFTGLRAGLVTARALGRARGVPVHGVPSLDAVARGRPQDVAADLDWAAKHQLLTRYARRAGTGLDDPRVVTLVSFVVTVLVCFIVASRMGGGGEADARVVWTEMGPAPVVLDTEGFDPAHLIDDDVFYDSTTMTPAEIAAFIARVNAGCRPGPDGTPCLAEATFTSVDREPTDMCPGGYTGAEEESAAQIVSKVATACDINPQVLLVLIQKEQGLLTASGRNLTARRYEAAAGYACPDASQCDRKWEGFFLQLYGAASQFQRYRLNPGSYDVVAQTPTRIAYSPDQACGGAELTIVNQATAGLYNYTPYQPNEAVKSGGKDECSSWGNWNFYGYFRTFFDDPTPSTAA